MRGRRSPSPLVARCRRAARVTLAPARRDGRGRCACEQGATQLLTVRFRSPLGISAAAVLACYRSGTAGRMLHRDVARLAPSHHAATVLHGQSSWIVQWKQGSGDGLRSWEHRVPSSDSSGIKLPRGLIGSRRTCRQSVSPSAIRRAKSWDGRRDVPDSSPAHRLPGPLERIKMFVRIVSERPFVTADRSKFSNKINHLMRPFVA